MVVAACVVSAIALSVYVRHQQKVAGWQFVNWFRGSNIGLAGIHEIWALEKPRTDGELVGLCEAQDWFDLDIGGVSRECGIGADSAAYVQMGSFYVLRYDSYESLLEKEVILAYSSCSRRGDAPRYVTTSGRLGQVEKGE